MQTRGRKRPQKSAHLRDPGRGGPTSHYRPGPRVLRLECPYPLAATGHLCGVRSVIGFVAASGLLLMSDVKSEDPREGWTEKSK